MKLRQVFFDIDGTLVDTAHAERRALARIVATSPEWSALSFERVAATWWAIRTRQCRGRLDGTCSLGDLRRDRFRETAETLGLALTEDRIDEWATRYPREVLAASALFPDVAALDALPSTLRLGAITDGDRSHQEAKLLAAGFHASLEPFVASAQSGAQKPAEQVFRRACRAAGWPAARCAHVGDRPEVDVAGAARAGLVAILIDRRDRYASFTGVRIGSLYELPNVLEASG